jgi:hypothetical protein
MARGTGYTVSEQKSLEEEETEEGSGRREV